jgi:hypothetical protein
MDDHDRERLDQITIALNSGDVPLTWASRQQLMARLQHIESSAKIRATFEAVGTTTPVALTVGQKAALLTALADWARGRDGYEAMSPELFTLRNLLLEEVVGAAASG